MKKILLSLFVLWLSFLSFSNAWLYTYTWTVNINWYCNPSNLFSLSVPYSNWESFIWNSPNWVHTTNNVDLTCNFSNISSTKTDTVVIRFRWYYVQGINWTSQFVKSLNILSVNSFQVNFTNHYWVIYVWYDNGDWNLTFPCWLAFDYSCTFSWDDILDMGGSSCPECPTCPECEVCTPQYTSQECQSEYNLIPISDIDSNYCTENDLCTFTGSYSNLVINDIWHESKPFIYVNIPEEIDWDYTGNSYSFTLDVWGYNTDSDYIAWIITTQKFTPDSSDFQKIITDVLPLFVPWLVIILFIYYIFRLIKKLF